jgi:NADH:ubiquinone oxidoreductase subunit 5 (subunit L)/multisubunit Na+/H+ antiporter MnhA subunit
LGAFTAIFAATIGITQNDIKKVLAYSTVSQLGFMFLAVWRRRVHHRHLSRDDALRSSKALMFWAQGSVIHGMHHEQDMRKMGNLRKYMPYTYWTFLAGWLAICGIIPFSGFWSKDEILWNAASTNAIPAWLAGVVSRNDCRDVHSVLHDALVAMTFWGKERFAGHEHGKKHEGHAQKKEHGTHDSTRTHRMNRQSRCGCRCCAGDPRDDWRICRISTAFTGGSTWRPHEHRQLDGADHLESDDEIVPSQRAVDRAEEAND